MSKTKSRNNDKKKSDNSKKGKGKNNKTNGSTKKVKQPRRVTEIVFDPEARKQYLCGFSERKKQRRAFGLAMQKVKDRKAKIEQRAERRLAVEEQIQEAEERKNQLSVAATANISNDNDSDIEDDIPENDSDGSGSECQNVNNVSNEDYDSENDDDNVPGGKKVQVYEDVHTKTQWGGDVIVTTTTKFDDDDESIDGDNHAGKRKKRKFESNDKAQEYSGKVERFMQQLKGNMPSKKKKENHRPIKHKGKHGAANMQGIGGDGNLKAAKKLLSRSQAKVGGPRGKNTKAKR